MTRSDSCLSKSQVEGGGRGEAGRHDQELQQRSSAVVGKSGEAAKAIRELTELGESIWGKKGRR